MYYQSPVKKGGQTSKKKKQLIVGKEEEEKEWNDDRSTAYKRGKKVRGMMMKMSDMDEMKVDEFFR